MVPLDHNTVPLLTTTVLAILLLPAPPATISVLFVAMVTEAAPFHMPDCQVNAPLITLAPTKVPPFCTRFVGDSVPLRLKPPAFSSVTPTVLVVM